MKARFHISKRADNGDCPFCDEDGIAVSPVTGARGVCRHPKRADNGENVNNEN